MWSAALIGLSLLAAQPAPEPYVQVECPFAPVFFENGTTAVDESGRQAVSYPLQAFHLRIPDATPGIVLRTGTNEPSPADIATLSSARAEAVRSLLLAQGIPSDRILIAHEYREGTPFALGNWVGGWVQLEFFMTPTQRSRLFPPGLVC